MARSKEKKEDQFSPILLTKVNEIVTILFSLTSKIFAVTAILMLTIWAIREYRSDDYFIDKIQVSPELEKLGYTESFLMNNLLESINKISIEAKSKSDYKEYISTHKNPEIKGELLGMGVSLNQFFEFTSELIGHKRKYIRCEVVQVEEIVVFYLHVHKLPMVKIIEKNTTWL